MPASDTDEWEPLFTEDWPSGEDEEVDAPGEAADALAHAVRVVRVAVIAVTIVFVAGVLSAVVRYFDDDGSVPRPPLPTDEGGVASSGGIGPEPGTSIAAYTAERESALAAVPDEAERRVALVTFTRYRTEDEARQALDRVVSPGTIEVLAQVVAVAGDRPQVVTGSLRDWATEYKAEAAAERADIEQLLPTVEPGSEWEVFYRSELDRLSAVINGADPGAPVVYAVTVRGPVRALRQLAATSTVRLVDVGPSDDPPEGDVYRGPLPDEVATIGNPQVRPAPVR